MKFDGDGLPPNGFGKITVREMFPFVVIYAPFNKHCSRTTVHAFLEGAA
jgi:hypothetical protein